MKFAVKLIFGFALCIVLLYYVNWKQTSEILINIAYIPALSALVILSINIFISSLKWRVLLHAHNIDRPWWELTRLYWISTFLGNYMPTSFGGDVFRVFMLNDVGRTATVAASIVIERLTGFIVLISWAAVALIMRPEYFIIGNVIIFLWLAVAGAIITIICLYSMRTRISRLLKSLASKITINRIKKIINKILNVIDSITEYKEKKKELAISFLLSVLFYSVVVICNYLVLKSVDSALPFKEVSFIVPIIPLISLLPISLNGLGISEGVYILFFTQAGLLPSQAFAAALIRRLIHVVISLCGYFFWLPKRSVINTQVSKLT